jgi:hypothetical protein
MYIKIAQLNSPKTVQKDGGGLIKSYIDEVNLL